ncbi:MAG: ABC transporter ATP-binding protein [Acidimicrobiales bacterium]
MSLLEVEGLTTHIKLRTATVQAVDGISFSVEAGQTVGLVGESGCGKSMTGNSIMRLLPPGGRIVSGSVRLDGRDLVALPEQDMQTVRGNEVGMVFQDPMTSLNPSMTIGRQIGEVVELHHRDAHRKDATERAAEVLALVGMPRPRERLDDYPHQLSGGLRQRVMIAMALACEPRLLIADEPTTALDVTIQAQILGLLEDLKERLGMAIILITHDMGVIAGRTDKTIVMYAGRIVEHADTGRLFARTRHPYTEALLASIPKIDMDPDEELYSIPGLPPSLTDPPPGCRFAGRCRYVQDRCRAEDPALGGEEPSHHYACFYPRSSGTDVTAGEPYARPLAAAGGVETLDGGASTLEGAGLGASVGEVEAPGLVLGGAERGPRRQRPSADSPVVVRMDGVTKDFPVTAGVLRRRIGTLKAVSGVALEVRAGETFALVGESGCGKTTIGRMLVALERPTGGRILVGDQDVASLHGSALRSARADLQLMFQDPYASLNPRMRVGPIIREPVRVQRRGTKAQQEDRVRELLAEVGLDPSDADRYPHEFSGGQRQRIGLARALALNPGLIVADEPVSALDVSIRSQILNLMKRLQRVHGMTYVIISHDLSVVRYMADRIGVMYLGKLVEVGCADDIYRRTAHPYTAGLLDAIPVPDPDVERQKRGKGVVGELPSPLEPPSGCVFRTRCPRAEERCAAEVPELRGFGGEHRAACLFPLQVPVEITAPVAERTSVH